MFPSDKAKICIDLFFRQSPEKKKPENPPDVSPKRMKRLCHLHFCTEILQIIYCLLNLADRN